MLTYEDDGVGIAETEKAKLFSEDQTSNAPRGHGLFLIKNLMNVYNWTIKEEGKPGKGVKFTITIPK